MSREADFKTRMDADVTLTAILTGGVYTAGAVGIEGISRDTTPLAFDAAGRLKPSALVRQRGLVPTGDVLDPITQQASASQVVEIYVYQRQGYTSIDTALARLYTLFQGYQFSDSFEVFYANQIDRERDEGALSGASLARIDFIVHSIRG